MPDPIEAVLVEAEGVQRWCVRESHRWAAGKLVEPYVYAYTDVVTGERLGPGQCREIREGKVQVTAVEVKDA